MSIVPALALLAPFWSYPHRPLPDTPGVTAKSVLVGQACALKGPAAGLGEGMSTGLSCYFSRVNAAGGVGGRKIELKSINDGYEPEKTELVTTTLIDKVGAFLLIGGVGTPTSKVAMPICVERRTPYVAPFTGAEFLRNPCNRWVVNVRASYYQEMERHAHYLVDGLGFQRVACFYQDDAYGLAGLAGIEQALDRRGMKLCATGTYQRNTTAVAQGLEAIAGSQPQAIVMVGAYTSCAAFIKAAKGDPRTKEAVFGNLSFVGTTNLLNELGGASEGCIVTQVVPFPWDPSVPVVREYEEAMKAAGKEAAIDFISLEGYLAGKFFCSVLEHVQGELTRDSFVDTIDSVGTFDLGGITLQFGPGDHQGLDQVWMTVFKGGKVLPLGENPASK